LFKIALFGNPNCGKTTLFNCLTGLNRYVGNRPGVTVKKDEGRLRRSENITVVDLPGIYSLSPFSPDERAAFDYLTDEKTDVIINIIDASHLSRSLYLTMQLLETDIPLVIALNMSDKLEKSGAKIDADILSFFFGITVVEICAESGKNIDLLIEKAKTAIKPPTSKTNFYLPEVKRIVDKAENFFANENNSCFLAAAALEGSSFALSRLSRRDKTQIASLTVSLEKAVGESTYDYFAAARYSFIDKAVSECLSTDKRKRSLTEKIDKTVLNRFAAFPIFFAVIFIIYYLCVSLSGSVFNKAVDILSLDRYFLSAVQSVLVSLNCAEWLTDLVLNGIIEAVGSVFGFLPQIFMLFTALGFLEESGYMARIAFLTDRVFRAAGLSGKSFIPLIIGSGCSVPALMATRTIENSRQRQISIIVTSFVPCSAKLTVIVFICSRVFKSSDFALLLAFVFAVCCVFLSGLLLKNSKTIGNSESVFLMELPSYRLPPLKVIFKSAAKQSLSFVKKTGSVILLSSILIWFLSYFSVCSGRLVFSESFEDSLLGHFTERLAVIFAPLGFGSPEMSAATLSGSFAKENIVGTLQVLSFQSADLSPVCALSFLAFNMLCPPCIVATYTIAKEMYSVKYTVFALLYQTAFAYAVSFFIFQFGRLIVG